MHAIILAGGEISLDDPLYLTTGVTKKALIPIAGRPMISWVVEAMIASGIIETILVIGLEGENVDVPFTIPLPDTGNIIDNLRWGREILRQANADQEHVLVCACDIPLLTSEMILEFLNQCDEAEPAQVYYAVVPADVMVQKFPEAKRTTIPFRDGAFCAGDMVLLDPQMEPNFELAYKLVENRKNPATQAQLLGLSFAARFAMGQLTLEQATKMAMKKANISAQVVQMPFAEVAMDIDKIEQFIQVKDALEDRLARRIQPKH